MPQVHLFNEQGELIGPLPVAKWALSDDEWRRRLNPEQFRVLRSRGTERPFCGTLLDNKREGVYTCAGCRLPLFSSSAKFNSGTGWPSFFQPIALGNVEAQIDHSHGMVRSEIHCARCDGHLGHVFDDGPRPTGLRFCLNSEALLFTPLSETKTLAEAAASAAHASIAAAVFGGGCFWCTEAAFEELAGVLDVESGYAGGTPETANYERVCAGDTGHAEVIRVRYDPQQIRFDQLLDVFFDAHDPTQRNRQGADIGTQYRSVVFFANETERAEAEQKIATLNANQKFARPIVTTLEPLEAFYAAESYHQDYARRNPLQPYIQAQAMPKVCKVRERHPELLRKSP